jgi:outer membrane protein TolC
MTKAVRTHAPKVMAVAVAVSLLLVASFGLAQQPLPTSDTTLHLSEALAAARRNAPAVLSAIGTVQSAQGQVALARTALMPFVTGAVTGTGYGLHNTAIGGTATPCPPGSSCFSGVGFFGYVSANVSVGARWMLWDFGRTALTVRAAQERARGATADVHSTERTVLATAATAYFAVLADQEAVAAARETLRQRERELEIAAARVTAGLDPQINRTRAEIAVQTARLELSTAEAGTANDAAALAATLGMDPVHAPRVVRPPEIALDDDPEHAANAAVTTRPEILAARLRVAGAEAAVAAARAAWRPWITASANAGVSYLEYSTRVGSLLETGSASVVLTVPIVDPTISANVRIAEGDLVAARATLAQQILNVRTDAVQAALSVRAARQQLEEATRNAELAAANLALSEGRFATGVAPMLELVDAQAQDATARLTVVQRRFLFESAKVRLLAAINRLSDLESAR